MSDRILLAFGIGILMAAFIAFLAWRIHYYAPHKVDLRRYRKERAKDIAVEKDMTEGEQP